MNKVDMVKGTLGLITSIGTTAIIGNIIKSTSDSEANPLTKVCITVAGMVFCGMAGKIAADHVESQVDEVVNAFNDVVANAKAKTAV